MKIYMNATDFFSFNTFIYRRTVYLTQPKKLIVLRIMIWKVIIMRQKQRIANMMVGENT